MIWKFLSIILSASLLANDLKYKVEGSVEFLAIGKPGFLKIKGESENSLRGEIRIIDQKMDGQFAVQLNLLRTGIDLRDDHMKNKYLEVNKFPEAKFVLDPVKISTLSENHSGKFSGRLTLKGVTRPVNGTYEYLAKTKQAKCEFTIKLGDYQIEIPKYMGITVSETADVQVKLKISD